MTARAQRRATAAVTVLAVVLATIAVGTGLVLARRDHLPDPVATHWGLDGADGFSSLTASLWIAGLVVGLLGALFAGLALAMHPSNGPLLAGFGVGTVLGLGVLTYGSVLAQSGLDDARDASSPGAVIGIGVVVGLAAGVVAGRLLRRPAPPAPARDGWVPPPEATWSGPLRIRPLALVLLVAGPAVAAVVAWIAEPWLVLLPAVVLVALLATSTGTVRIDAEGLTVRSTLGVRLVRVPAERITGAEVTTVSPLRDFGGWGIRVSRDGSRGHITSAGPALRVHRHLEPDVVITVDDADTAAAVLARLVPPVDAERER